MIRRKGRGRLSSIEMLPDHAAEAVQEALSRLAERDMDQQSILADLNARLAGLDPPVPSISKSAFNRYSMRFAAQAGKLAEAREMAAAMAERMDEMPEGDVGLMLGETVKVLINDVIMDGMLSGESPSILVLKEASNALKALEQGRLANAKTSQIKVRDFVEQAADVASTAAQANGLTSDTVAAIRSEILGVAQ